MDEKVLLSGYHFDDGPCLIFDRISGKVERFSMSLLGKNFSLKAHPERYCTGSFNLGTLEGSPCVNQTELESKANQSCYPCFELTGFNPSFYHMAKSEISPQQRAYNNTPHAVYLAYFTDGLIKVGISSEKRKEVRWVEQGARIVAHIMTCPNAYEARHNEETISKALKLPEVVLGKKKRTILAYSLDVSGARKVLNELISEIQERLSPMCHTDRFYTLDHVYNPRAASLNNTIIDLSDGDERKISGKFIGLYGDILVVENGQNQFMLALKKIIGHGIELADSIEDVDFDPQQISLF